MIMAHGPSSGVSSPVQLRIPCRSSLSAPEATRECWGQCATLLIIELDGRPYRGLHIMIVLSLMSFHVLRKTVHSMIDIPSLGLKGRMTVEMYLLTWKCFAGYPCPQICALHLTSRFHRVAEALVPQGTL